MFVVLKLNALIILQMRTLFLKLPLFFVLPFNCFSQAPQVWMSTPKEQWPQIALANHVQFKNGDRYIDPSFDYAGTGFLIDTGKDTLAVTAKHVLWIARNRKTKAVEVNNDLNSWIMKPKGGSYDSVVIDRLINEDTTETLEGSSSTILERDWLVFSVKRASPRIVPLKPRYTAIKPGETVFIIGYSYSQTTTTIYEGKVLQMLGMDILIEQHKGHPLPGTSGSPVIDANGFLIGILSSSSTEPGSGKNVTVAISTEYLEGVLTRGKDLNTPKKDYGVLVLKTVLEKGTKKAIRQYIELTNDPKNYYIYNLWSANRNGLRETGEKLLEMKRFQNAVDILEFNVKVNPAYYRNYNLLAKALLLSGNKEKAIESYKISTTRFDDQEENEAFKELEKLGVTR
jgi:hypothetical protein